MGLSGVYSVFIVVSSGLSFIINRGHLLVSLLSLEYLALGLYGLVSFVVSLGDGFSLYYLAVVVCEGALGLSLLVAMAYSYGSDLLSLLSLGVC